jgi:hypothetical protein
VGLSSSAPFASCPDLKLVGFGSLVRWWWLPFHDGLGEAAARCPARWLFSDQLGGRAPPRLMLECGNTVAGHLAGSRSARGQWHHRGAPSWQSGSSLPHAGRCRLAMSLLVATRRPSSSSSRTGCGRMVAPSQGTLVEGCASPQPM